MRASVFGYPDINVGVRRQKKRGVGEWLYWRKLAESRTPSERSTLYRIDEVAAARL